MLTSAKVESQFRRELQELLDRWDAELEADDHYRGYPECGSDIRMKATIESVWDDEGNRAREYTEIDLGRILFPSKD